MVSRATVVAVVCCCLLVSTAASGVVAGATQPAPSSTSSTDSVDSEAEACFPADGYAFAIGDQGPKMNMILHLSLLTNLGGPGAFGVELDGSIGGPPIIELRTGVIFGGIDSVGSFLDNPFEPFSIAFEYLFEIPALDGVSYETSDSPVDGPVGNADC